VSVRSELVSETPLGGRDFVRLHGAERIDIQRGEMVEELCESECSLVAATAPV
jgi:hypothetical protein